MLIAIAARCSASSASRVAASRRSRALARGARCFRFVFRAPASRCVLLVAGAVARRCSSLGIEGMQALTKEETRGADQGRADRPAALRRDASPSPTAASRPTTWPATTSTSTATSSSGRRSPTCSACTPRTGSTASPAATARSSRRTRRGGRSIRSARRRWSTWSRSASGCRSRDFFDAEYGSATYVPVAGPAELELMVSTTGLLLRPVAPPAHAAALTRPRRARPLRPPSSAPASPRLRRAGTP